MFRAITSLVVVASVCLVAVPRTFGQKSQSSSPPSEAKLIAILKSSDASQKARADACRELGRIGTKEAIAPLAALLCDEKLSHMARYGLEPIPDPAVDAALRDALGKVKGRQLVGVIGSLGVRRDHKSVTPLIKYLEDPDPEVVQASARSLGRIGTVEASKALETNLSRTPEANRLAFYEGLFRCADTLRAQGQRDQARAIYEELKSDPSPPQVKAGATRAAETLRPRG
jgi:HEAT repeat protein